MKIGEKMILKVDEGDDLRIVWGWEKRLEKWKEKFEKGVNFRGFKNMKGNDEEYEYVKRKND